MATFPADYPNAAGIQLAWHIAAAHDSPAPIAEIAQVLTGEPWNLDYHDAAQVVAAALRKPDTEGETPDA